MSLITVIGRGHSGTRAISHTLTASGVFMGEPLNGPGDLIPGTKMYQACRVFADYVDWKEGLNWDWSRVFSGDIPNEFKNLIKSYLDSVLSSSAEYRGWKIPETTLCFPWIVRMFPDAKYIFWIRNPRDCILGGHWTDDLGNLGIQYPQTDELRMQRAISWKYQYEIVKATTLPAQWIQIRFEDFVLNQDETITRLQDFLEFPIEKIPVRPEAVGRWQADDKDPSTGANYFDFFKPAMREFGYEIPADSTN